MFCHDCGALDHSLSDARLKIYTHRGGEPHHNHPVGHWLSPGPLVLQAVLMSSRAVVTLPHSSTFQPATIPELCVSVLGSPVVGISLKWSCKYVILSSPFLPLDMFSRVLGVISLRYFFPWLTISQDLGLTPFPHLFISLKRHLPWPLLSCYD